MTTIPMELSVKLSDVTGCGKTKMAEYKLRLRISQLVHKIATKYLCIVYMCIDLSYLVMQLNC